ncbi:MAG: porin [Bradyrhizobiaceae bacterium]|nr:porin [Bradyrhizobiaceae bacterium]
MSSLAVTAAATILFGGPAAAQEDKRLDALQAQIAKLQKELAALRGDVSKSKEEIRKANERAAIAKAAPQPDQPIVKMSSSNRPEICSADGRNCIALTSRLHLDVGGYDYRPNTAATAPQNLIGGPIARRAQLGVIGKFLDDWEYSLVLEAGGSGGSTGVILDTGYLAYNGFKPFKIWGGQFGVPYTLDESTSSNNITFMERAAPQQVAVSLGGGTRSAFGVTTNDKQWWAGAFLTGPVIGNGATALATRQAAVTGRVVFLPVLTDNASLLIGGSAQYLFDAPQGGLNLRDRIELRIDGARVLGTGTLPIEKATVLSAEVAGTLGSFHFQGEYFDFDVERTIGSDLGFSGGYIQAGYILTGEKRSYSSSSGAYGGVTPKNPFDWKKGGWGAWEIAARYSMIDLDDPAGGVFGGRQENITAGLNWYVNRNIRFLFNYIHGKVEKQTGGGVDIGAKYDAVGMRTQVAF